MKVKEAKYLIENSPYYQELTRLKNLDYDTYETRWKYENIYGASVYNFVLSMLENHTPKFKESFTINFDFFEFECHLYIGPPRYYHDKEIEAKIHISSNRNITDYWCNGWNIIDLKDTDNLKNLKEIATTRIRQYFWSSGMLEAIQFQRGCSKKDTNFYFKHFFKTFHKQPGINEDLILKKIKRKFNIDSHVSIKTTVSIVNQIGPQKELKKVYAFDYPDLDYFDGDIDQLENEINELNPGEKNVIYV